MVSITAKGAVGIALVAQHMLGQPLMQAKRHDQAVGEAAGDAIGLQQGRHLGLATRAAQPLADVEDEIPALAGGEALGQAADMADAHGRHAIGGQRPLEAVDGLRGCRTPPSPPRHSRRRDIPRAGHRSFRCGACSPPWGKTGRGQGFRRRIAVHERADKKSRQSRRTQKQQRKAEPETGTDGSLGGSTGRLGIFRSQARKHVGQGAPSGSPLIAASSRGHRRISPSSQLVPSRRFVQ